MTLLLSVLGAFTLTYSYNVILANLRARLWRADEYHCPPPFICRVFSYTSAPFSHGQVGRRADRARLPQGKAALTSFCSLAGRVFGLRERSHDFPSAFPAFGGAPTTSPAHFRPLGAFPRLPRRVSGLRERSHGFPGTFPDFARGRREKQFRFGSDKNHHTVRSFYGKS